MGEPTIQDLLVQLQWVIQVAHQLNAPEQPTRSEELSLAIVNARQALMWLEIAPVTSS